MITDFAIKNYRSAKDVWLKLKKLTIIVGPNGCGKSNLYRALQLMSSGAQGRLALELANEGGIRSAIWAGSTSLKDESFINLSIKTETLRYDLAVGSVPQILEPSSLFAQDIEVKTENIQRISGSGVKNLLKRKRLFCEARGSNNETTDYTKRLRPNESVLAELIEPHRYPQIAELREELRSWRFFHTIRTDPESPVRQPNFPVATACIAEDASDLVTSIATILEMGDASGFLESFEDAFPDARLYIETDRQGLKLLVKYKGIHRMFDATNLSDGTLQYICLLTILYALAPPPLLAINEPETSIHEDLMEPLARLLVKASEHSQVWVTTHSQLLADYVLDIGGYQEIQLEKDDGETKMVGVGLGGYQYEIEEGV